MNCNTLPPRQYIGARYVPTFANPVEWDINRSYEALTIVTYLGTSYTSKIPVPANTPISDTKYWVVTGNYNQQVEEYRQSVVELQNKFNSLTLTGQNAHFFGDSLTYGTTGSGRAVDNYPATFGKITGANVYNHAVPGATCCEISEQWNWLSQQISAADLSDANYVFIQIGINDYSRGYPIGEIDDSVKYFKGAYFKAISQISRKTNAYCKIICLTLFPNGAFFSNSQASSSSEWFISFNRAIREVAKAANVQCLDTTYTIGINVNNWRNIMSDGTHLTNEGYKNIGRTLAQAASIPYSDRPVISGENFFKPEHFFNNQEFAGIFNNQTNGIVLNLSSGGKTTFASYYLEAGKKYTMSFTVYNENESIPHSSNYNSILIHQRNSSYNKRVLAVYNSALGLTDYSGTFTCDSTGSFKFEFSFATNLTDKKPCYIAGLRLTEGETPVQMKPKITNYLELGEYMTSAIVRQSNQNIYCKQEGGNILINGQFITTAELATQTVLFENVPKFSATSDVKASPTYFLGFIDPDSFAVFAYIPNQNCIKNITVLPANKRIVITGMMSFYF